MKNRIVLGTVVLAVLFAGCTGGVVDDGENGPTTEPPSEVTTSEAKASTETATSTPVSTPQETPTVTQTPVPTATAVPDSDGDGLNNLREEELGTDPTKKDTDGDSIPDYAEVKEHSTDPTEKDTDGDGLDDGAEIRDYGTKATVADTDQDGLSDYAEIHDYQTNPLVADTDDDSLPDGAEINKQDLFPDADPLHKDVYVAVDYTEAFDDEYVDDMKQEFRTAPTSNPDQTRGIELHVYFDDELTCRGPVERSYPVEYRCAAEGYTTGDLDKQDSNPEVVLGSTYPGYYSVRIVETVSRESGRGMPVDGFARGTRSFVEEQPEDEMTASIFLHEVGHQLGIDGRYAGVDSYNYALNRYPSVMNYNADNTYLSFSTQSPRDRGDWEIINASLDNRFDAQAILDAENKRD